MKSALAGIYRGATAVRAALYDRGALKVHRIDGVKIVSVGNLRMGGTGKTPLAIHLALRLQKRGIRSALLIRGYRGAIESRGGLVSSGHGLMVRSAYAGDEAAMAAVCTRGIPVWAGARRESGARVLRDLGSEVVVVDDGFQRRSLHRDLDIVLVCPEDLSPRTELLPKGPLRERCDALRRAHLVGGSQKDFASQRESPDFLFSVSPTSLISMDRETPRSIEDFSGCRVHLVSGIARPDRFEETAQEAGFFVTSSSVFPDHHKFSEGELGSVRDRAIRARCDLILTTEKDLSRMEAHESNPPLFALRIQMVVKEGSALVDNALGELVRSASSLD